MTFRAGVVGIAVAVAIVLGASAPARAESAPATQPTLKIVKIEPPEKEFYSKQLVYDGIPIKTSGEVSDEAMVEAYRRIESMLQNQPNIRANLRNAGAELHIIGKNQGTSDLPELRQWKGKIYDPGRNQTLDERARGLGGRTSSCGEENLLKLETDRYFGRDICRHEFGHCVFGYGIPGSVRQKFIEQRQRSLEKGLWVNGYAGSNPHEFFAELTMWYFGTHGDMHMRGPKPADGREGLKAYDPEAYKLFDDFYTGRLVVPEIPAAERQREEDD